MVGAAGDAEHDDVGAGADGGEVATEVGTERERPPQHIGMRQIRMLADSSPTIGVMVAVKGMLSMTPDTGAEMPRISIAVSKPLPPVNSVAARASWSMTPVLTSAPTMTNKPAKNSSVSHSTLAR